MHHYESASGSIVPSKASERHHGRGNARPRVFKEAAHPPGLRALDGDQPHMPPYVIAVPQCRKPGFVGICIFFETFDTFLDQMAESATDFKTFARIRGSVVQSHSKLHVQSG
jgi:hypothetical protein